MRPYLLILFIPLLFHAQDEKLRIETINVFKEFQPQIANSKKIGEQPIFTDTLSVDVLSTQSILNKNLKFKETILYKSPSKFRLNKINNDFRKYFSINVGNHTFLNTKFHYNNGLSVVHNSGVYLEHNSEDLGLKSPYYKNVNGELLNSIKLYSNRFLNDKLLETSFQFTRKSGIYWGGLEHLPIDTISNSIGKEINIKANLKQLSKTKFLKLIYLQLNSFSHNYGRQELCFKSSFNFELEKGLRKYSFSFSSNMINTSFSPYSTLNMESLILPSFNSKIATAFYQDETSDVLLKSKLLISGTKLIDYKLGLDFQYYKLSDFYDNAWFDDVKYFIFPTIKLCRNMKNNQRVEFLIEKDFEYHAFTSLFNGISYVDPYYRNSVTNETKVSLIYNKEFAESFSFFSSLNYSLIKNKLMPFLMSSESEYASLFLPTNDLMHPLGFYLSDFNGIVGSSSFSFSKTQYDLLISGTINMLHSTEHLDRNVMPLIELHSMLTINLFKDVSISSHAYFLGERDAIRLPSVLVSNDDFTYVNLESYFNINLSMQYNFKNMIFSIDFKNLLGERMEFFDGYYDDDRLKFRLGFLYNF